MTLWGGLVLMPSLRTASFAVRNGATFERMRTGRGGAERTPQAIARAEHAKRVLLTQVIFAYAYWTVCGLLVLGLLGVAWLDFREVLRNYSARRRKLWMEAIDLAQKGQSLRNGSPKE
jgi:hypothetical protein